MVVDNGNRGIFLDQDRAHPLRGPNLRLAAIILEVARPIPL